MVNNQTQVQKKRERSTSYPGLTLENAIVAVRQLKVGLGKGPYSREAIAKALGHSKLTGPAARKVAALGHYGLLQKDGSAYNLSDITLDILNPISENQKNVALIGAALKPRLFEKLFEQYKGQSLPTMLYSILIREGVSEVATKEVVSIFTTTFEFVGLLKNGVLRAKVQDLEIDTTKVEHSESTTKRNEARTPSSPEQTMSFNFPGGLSLTLPRTPKTEMAVMDGELKTARELLNDFASKYCITNDDVEENNHN